jgi:hypothetical protein
MVIPFAFELFIVICYKFKFKNLDSNFQVFESLFLTFKKFMNRIFERFQNPNIEGFESLLLILDLWQKNNLIVICSLLMFIACIFTKQIWMILQKISFLYLIPKIFRF